MIVSLINPLSIFIMKKFILIATISSLFIGVPTYTKAHENHFEEISDVITFEAWWEESNNNCTIKFLLPKNLESGSFQVDDGIPIVKSQFLEVFREVVNRGSFQSKKYIYHLTYKDENSKVSTSKVIFINQEASRRFQKALENFGIY